MRKHLVKVALCLGIGLPLGAATASTPVADFVYRNGRIYTLDAKSSVVQAVAVLGGKFLTVGSNADATPFIGPKTLVVDLGGKPVIPGLNDAHVHTIEAGGSADRVPLADTTTMAQAMERIRQAAAKKKPGEWIIGETWHPTAQLAEQRFPTRQDLDAAAPRNPVALLEHVSSFNSAALRLAGIDRSTPDPEGGKIGRDASGEPNGIFEEKASQLVTRLIPPPTTEQLEAGYARAMKVVNGYGITSVTDPGLSPTAIRALQRLMVARAMTVRYSVMYNPPAMESPERWSELTNANGSSSGFGNEWLKFDAIGEMAADGGMTFGTAYTRAAYPGRPDYRGVPAMTVERLNSNVITGNRNDWRFSIHTVGDASIDQVLDAFEKADKDKSIAGRRFAVMHGSLIQRDQLERMKRLGVILELQNLFLWDKSANVEKNLGAAAANRAIPNRLAIDILGINNVSSGSDFPSNIINPWINLYMAVTRKDMNGKSYGAAQAITREEALRLYTVSGAYATFDEGVKGTIEPGRLADFVVLDRDYFTIAPEQIKDIMPLRTVVGGTTVFARN